MSQEVRLLSTGCARGLQLENGCSEWTNPQGFEWDFVGCTHTHTHTHECRHLHTLRHEYKSLWQTQKTTKIAFKGKFWHHITYFFSNNKIVLTMLITGIREHSAILKRSRRRRNVDNHTGLHVWKRK